MTNELETLYERFCIMTETQSDEKVLLMLQLSTSKELFLQLKELIKNENSGISI